MKPATRISDPLYRRFSFCRRVRLRTDRKGPGTAPIAGRRPGGLGICVKAARQFSPAPSENCRVRGGSAPGANAFQKKCAPRRSILPGFPGLGRVFPPWHIRCSAAFGMKCVESFDTEVQQAPVICDVRLPMGMLGFEQMKEYLLIANPAEEPFRWLQVKNNPSLAFVVIKPFLVAPDYHPDIPQPDVDFLGIKAPEDAALLNIVTLHGPNRATVNLKGPVVINRNTGIGKQVIIANAADYSVQHPLPTADATA
jgi:flagellar assembly factor FliW